MELKVERRHWEFLLTLEPGEVPDQKLKFRSSSIRPEWVYLTVELGRDDSARISKARVIGPRVTKSGGLGVSMSETYAFRDELPEWLVPIASGAIQAATADVSD